jgi:pyrrolidone-carboxylate peptidase
VIKNSLEEKKPWHCKQGSWVEFPKFFLYLSKIIYVDKMSKNVVVIGFNKNTQSGTSGENLARKFIKKVNGANLKGYTIKSYIFKPELGFYRKDIFNLIAKERPPLLLMINSSATTKILVENQAVNDDFFHKDPWITKITAPDVAEYFKAKFKTNVPPKKLAKIPKALSFPARINYSMPKSPSNDLYYSCLYAFQQDTISTFALFYHIPNREFDYENFLDIIQISIEKILF